jgi:hypothetical protein
MHNVAAMDSYGDTSRRILAFSIILTPRHDEDAIAAHAEARKRTLTLLANITMYGHKVLGTIHQDNARLRPDVRKEASHKS